MNRLSFLIITTTLVFIFSCKKESDYVISLQPDSAFGKDAFIEDYPYDDYRNRNWGKSEAFAAISWTAGGVPLVVRSFIDFNFDTLPANAIIESAKLSLFAYGNTGHGMGHDTLTGSNECYLQRIVEDWQEDSITWNTQPQTTEINQILLPRSDSIMQDYKGINVTNLVRDIYNNSEDSYGLMLRLKTEDGYRRMFFATSDVPEVDKRPKLDIYYTLKQ